MSSFDYFQITTLVIFLSIFFARSLWLTRKGVKVFRLGRGKKGIAYLLEKSFLIFFPLWLFEIFVHAAHINFHFLPSVLTDSLFHCTVIKIVGVVLIVFSLIIFSLALVSFKSSWRVGIDTVAPGGLITTGIFSLSRNPIFLSMNLYFLGTFMIYSNLFFLLGFIGMVIGSHIQLLHEEAFLNEKYGKPYQTYSARVRRYI